METRRIVLAIIVIAVFISMGFLLSQVGCMPADDDNELVEFDNQTETDEETGDVDGVDPEATPLPTGPEQEVVFQDLTIPWELVFLPEGGMLITERAGNLIYIAADSSQTVIPIERANHVGEGGLLGMTLHPSFADNNFIYLYVTSQLGDSLINRVERHSFSNGVLTKDAVIIDSIPGARIHNGGRIAFGPDGMLYVATGDAGVPSLSQDRDSLAGKILRIYEDGSIPADNPFGTPVYSYGHRNPQGLTWDSAGNFWATEHGARAHDELNHILPGRNYGWPEIEGDETATGMEIPAAHSGRDETWAPSGAAYYDGSIFFTGLRGATLYEAVLSGAKVEEVKRHLQQEYGRLRTVVTGPDGYLYLLTNNQDGRGSPGTGDDKIIRINPRIFR